MAAVASSALPPIDPQPLDWVRERTYARLAPALVSVTGPVLAGSQSEAARLGVLAAMGDVMGDALLRAVWNGAWSGEGATRAATVLSALAPALERLRAEAALHPVQEAALRRDALAAYGRAERELSPPPPPIEERSL